MNSFISIAILSIALYESAFAASGKTTRYWDCCKPSCSWKENLDASVKTPVKTCQKDGKTAAGAGDMNCCSGDAGIAYMCASNQPKAINATHSIGFVAGNINGLSMQQACCTCWLVKFTSGPVAGKTMAVQLTNTGSDLGNNHFDIQMPGGGVGIFNGCGKQYDYDTTGKPIYTGPYRWGNQYGGISQRSECDNMPADLKAGCQWRFDWFQNADNPTMDVNQINCPAEITAITGCAKNL